MDAPPPADLIAKGRPTEGPRNPELVEGWSSRRGLTNTPPASSSHRPPRPRRPPLTWPAGRTTPHYVVSCGPVCELRELSGVEATAESKCGIMLVVAGKGRPPASPVGGRCGRGGGGGERPTSPKRGRIDSARMSIIGFLHPWDSPSFFSLECRRQQRETLQGHHQRQPRKSTPRLTIDHGNSQKTATTPRTMDGNAECDRNNERSDIVHLA